MSGTADHDQTKTVAEDWDEPAEETRPEEDDHPASASALDAGFIEMPPAEPGPVPDLRAAIDAKPAAVRERASAVSPAVRDRIVVLGRRKAGKTIFLARLYEQLWRSTGNIHIRAVDGNDHLFFMETIRVLSERVWPPATGSSTRIPLEIAFDGRHRSLISLDYSGEVFKRAFLEGISDPDTDELLEHLDRAAAVILLVDPGLALHGTPEQIAEDEFGMTAAVRRIRRAPGGGAIPIALVLTKLDAYGRVVRECGGLVGFVKTHLFPLLRALHRVRVFGCVAVRTRPDAIGTPRPDPATPALGLLEPLEHCLRSIPETPSPLPQPPRAQRPPSIEEAAAAPVPWRFLGLMAVLVLVGIAVGLGIAWALGISGVLAP